MKTMPKIGTKVLYRSIVCGKARECSGVVVAHYPGYGEECRDEETGETWISPDHVGVKVDSIPDWWAYPGTDRFAPDIAELRKA